jgi:hypothetical protein
MRSVIELWRFLRARRRYWMWPAITFLIVLGTVLVFTQASAIGPFLYSLF